MIVGIHQPNYIPWIGYFYKILNSDVFVILDDVQYIKNSFINRNKIKTPQGDCWLTVPVCYKGNFGSNINEVKINNELKWNDRHLKTISMNYSKAKYFNKYYEDIYNIIKSEYTYIDQLNINLITYFCKQLKIHTKIVKSSELNVNGNSTERLINICKTLKADTYLSGKGGEKYQDEDMYRKNGIKLIYTNFKHPFYTQLWGEFIPNLSILDLLFNCGEESIEIIKNKY